MTDQSPIVDEKKAQQWDRCLSNLIVKSGIGLGTGVVLSVLLFKRRAWPVMMSTGFGMGYAYSDCQIFLNAQANKSSK
ncbi:uncharacterized protein VTP21DRAFT_6249 [Calcarisporiella thermophila]|uniref:uncharacterized protein n=1 Tax=Calcarisporiella thermophila TaxID=911321 RepID=UPI0037426E00